MGRKIPMWQTGFVMIFCGLAFMYCLDVLEIMFGDAWGSNYGDLHMPLVLSSLVAAAVAIANGFKWNYLEQAIVATISRSLQAILILLTVGILIGTWISSGVIPTLIFYGLAIMNPTIFLAATCLICCVVSLILGTSWGTTGTMGVAFIGIGMGLMISPAMTAGAAISGAYFGDKMSPLSDTTNLSPAIVGGVTLFEHIKYMIWTVTPSLIFSVAAYLVLGFSVGGGSDDLTRVEDIRNAMVATFNINPILLVAPLVVIIVIALRIPPLPGLFAGVIIGGLMGIIFQGLHFGEMLDIMHYGFSFPGDPAILGEDLYSDLDRLLSRGGLDSKLWTISLVIVAMCFGGIMDGSGMLATMAESLLKLAKSTGMLVVVTLLSCILTNMLTADQYLALIIPGRMYKRAFEDRRLKTRLLARTIEGGGTMTSALVPWNTCGATMSRFTGVPTVEYLPYAFMNWSSPIVNAFYGFTGISIDKYTEEEYAKILKERAIAEEAEAEALRG